MTNFLEEKHVKNQFITNPEWERVFLKHFPNWTIETYEANAEEVFRKNGYTFVPVRRSKNPDSKFYCIVELELYKDGEWQESITLHEDFAVQAYIIDLISNYDVDISKFE